MRINQIEDINDIFSIFHDGSITAASLQGECLILEIEIQYLAERINPDYKGFKVSLYDFRNAEFTPWSRDLNSKPEKITDLKSIFKAELEILKSKVNGIKIEVIFAQDTHEYDNCGGVLSFSADSAKVQDTSGKFYTIQELKFLFKDYWDEWAAKNEY